MILKYASGEFYVVLNIILSRDFVIKSKLT